MKRISLNGYVYFEVVNTETNQIEEVKEEVFRKIDNDTYQIGEEYFETSKYIPEVKSEHQIAREKYTERCSRLYADLFHNFRIGALPFEDFNRLSRQVDDLIYQFFPCKSLSYEQMFVGHLAMNIIEKEGLK